MTQHLKIMNNYKTILGSKYPIIAMAMNKVSDINLAKAVRLAGGLPSLSGYNYNNNYSLLEQDILEYKNTFNDAKLLLSIGVDELLTPQIFKMIIDYNVEFIELIPDTDEENPNKEINEDNKLVAVKLLNNAGIKVFIKCLGRIGNIDNVTGLILKGREGAGRGFYKTDPLFDHVREKHPSLHIIISGGIGTAEQVAYYMNKGALAIGIGTLFAACKESKISIESKLKMINASSTDITRFSTGAAQNALIFTEVENDNFNHTAGIRLGVQGVAAGHIFAGESIDQITGIVPVENIINILVSQL